MGVVSLNSHEQISSHLLAGEVFIAFRKNTSFSVLRATEKVFKAPRLFPMLSKLSE